jgi:CheY-like chemotaxis protein
MNNQKRRILIVDDDQSTREMYGEIFSDSGFEVMKAKDGVEGLDIATRENPDVIFTGIVMPRMDGFTMIESLKKNVQTAAIPVVISSHMGREADRQRANVLGAKDFIIRDVTPPNEAVKRVKSLFSMESEYRIDFNPYNLDAQKIARELGLNNNFQCLECSERVVLRLRILDPKEKTFRAKFICPNCGWEAG